MLIDNNSRIKFIMICLIINDVLYYYIKHLYRLMENVICQRFRILFENQVTSNFTHEYIVLIFRNESFKETHVQHFFQ